jgi:hypothetical protein
VGSVRVGKFREALVSSNGFDGFDLEDVEWGLILTLRFVEFLEDCGDFCREFVGDGSRA